MQGKEEGEKTQDKARKAKGKGSRVSHFFNFTRLPSVGFNRTLSVDHKQETFLHKNNNKRRHQMRFLSFRISDAQKCICGWLAG